MEDLNGAGGSGRGPDQQSGANRHNQNLMNEFLGQQAGQSMPSGFELDPSMMANMSGDEAYYSMGMMPPQMSAMGMQPGNGNPEQPMDTAMMFGGQNSFYNGSGNMNMANMQNMGPFQHAGVQNMGGINANSMMPARNPGQQQQLRPTMNMASQSFGHMGPPQRRPSMLEFSSGQNSDFSNFMFTHNGIPAENRSNQNAFDVTSPVLANQQAFQFPQQQQQQQEQQQMRPGGQSRAQSYMSMGAQTPLSLGGGIAQRRANSLLLNRRRESQGSLALETPDFSQVMSAVDGYGSATQSPIFNSVNMNDQFVMPNQNNFPGNLSMNDSSNDMDMTGMANSNQQISTEFNNQLLQNMNLYNNSAFPERPSEQMLQQSHMQQQPQQYIDTNQQGQFQPQAGASQTDQGQHQHISQQDQPGKAKSGSSKADSAAKKATRTPKTKQSKSQKSQDTTHSQQQKQQGSDAVQNSSNDQRTSRKTSPESARGKSKKTQSATQSKGDTNQESTPADPNNLGERQKNSLDETPAQVAPPLEKRPNPESGEAFGSNNGTKAKALTTRRDQNSSNEDDDAEEDSSESPPDESMRNFGAFAPTYQYKSDAQGNNFMSGPNVSNEESSGKKDLPSYLNIYSSTGFDMLGVLMRVATRKDPQINIGAVDLSCAFVVCDVDQHDLPIVYCSDMFEKLTGYVKQEILGRNCRFLQAPDGRVQSGVKRKYVDDNSVYHLKSQIKKKQEAQISLINYRKGGQPFMNLLTMIPVPWNGPDIKYYVGFQVDLVEQPASITKKHGDGTYSINYQRGSLPSYNINATPESSEMRPDHRTEITAPNEVSTILATIGVTESGISQSLWDKILVENSDDVVYVLSLKGIIQYISPACKKILEYEPFELLGAALSSICHPSDIVPVTRELKDASAESPVNVVFRIRRKLSGYTWFESQGSLHLEQGKGRKCIILVGRQRPIYAVNRSDITGDFGEQELWSKMSTSGMFLFVSAHAKNLLDRQPEELVGTSAQSLMRVEARAEFGQALEIARAGEQITFKHDVQNKRGQSLHAQTTLYPGDAKSNSKPTFLIAQTRLLRPSRTHATLHKQTSNASDQVSTMNESISSAATSLQSGGTKLSNSLSGGPSIASRLSQPQPFRSLEAHNTTLAGCHGLQIGNQDDAIANEDNIFDELQTTRSTSWQYELRQMEKSNRLLAEELQALLSERKKRKRRKGSGMTEKECANCHTRNTPEWRRGPSGQRDLCNSCGLRWAKQSGKLSPRTSPHHRMSLSSNFSPQGAAGSHPSPSQTPVSDGPASLSASTDANKDKETRRTPHDEARPSSNLKTMGSADSGGTETGGTGGTTPHANSRRTKSDATPPRPDVEEPSRKNSGAQGPPGENSGQDIKPDEAIDPVPNQPPSKDEIDDGIIDLDADADAEEDMDEEVQFQGMPTITKDSVAAEQGGHEIMEVQRASAQQGNEDEAKVKPDLDDDNVDTQMEGG